MIEHILIAALICNPALPGRTIVYPVETLNSVASKFIPGSEALSNSVLRTDAIAACATADACLQRMIIPRLSPYGGERNASLDSLYAEDMGLFRPSSTNYGVYGKAWFQGFSVYADTNLNYFIPASNRVFKSRIGARLRDYVEDFIFGSTNGNGRTQFDDMGSFRWIDPTVNHASLVRSGWKRDDMLDTADWSRYLRALSEFKPDGVSYGRFCPDHEGNALLDPVYQVYGLYQYMTEGSFPIIERRDMTGEEPKLIDLVYSRCHVRTNGVASASGRLSYDRMAMANGVISLCDTSMHKSVNPATYYPRYYEGEYPMPTGDSYPFYRFSQRQYTLAKSATLVRDISPSAVLIFGNMPGSDDPAMWKSVHYFPRDSDLENPRLSQSCETTSVVTNFVDVDRIVNVWSDVNPNFRTHVMASRPLRFDEFNYDASPVNDDEPYYLFVHVRPSPSYDENPSKDVTRLLIAELWAGRTVPSVGYPQPEVKIGSLNLSGLTGWTGSLRSQYDAKVQGVETLEKRPFIGPTYATTPDDQAAHYWDYSVNPYLPKEDVFELVEQADGYSFQTVAVNTNHAEIADMAGRGEFAWGRAVDIKDMGVMKAAKDTWAFFKINHKDLGKPNGDILTSFLTQGIYRNIEQDIIDVYGMAPHAELDIPTASAAAELDASDLQAFKFPVLIGGEEQPASTQYRIRTEADPVDKNKRKLILETAAGAAVPFDTVIYHVGINSGSLMPNCPGFRSVAAFCSEIPYFTLKWKFPSMRFSGEKSK